MSLINYSLHIFLVTYIKEQNILPFKPQQKKKIKKNIYHTQHIGSRWYDFRSKEIMQHYNSSLYSSHSWRNHSIRYSVAITSGHYKYLYFFLLI